MPCLLRALAIAAALLAPAMPHAGQVRVAVAAGMAGPVEKIVGAFRRETGHEVVVALGSTTRLYAQMRGGAPFEVLLAADEQFTAMLEREGLAVPGTRFTYASVRLALWSADASAVDPQGNVLRQPPRGRLAVPNPQAPYGDAAIQVLGSLGVLGAWQPYLMLGDSVGQTYQLVANGSAPIGFVALPQVMAEGRIAKGSAWIVPQQMYAPLRQDAVLLNAGRSNAAASALLQFLKGESAHATLRSYGYE